MLSGEGNENDDKTTIRLIGKNTSLHVQHTFFVHFFAVVLHDNVKLPSYAFYGGNVVRVFFFTAAHFHLRGRKDFSFCHRRYKIFMSFFQQ